VSGFSRTHTTASAAPTIEDVTKGSDVRTADHPIDRLFLDRWSPRAMSGEAIDEPVLLTLFEAARWAPSSGNSQSWRFLYARRDTPHWPLFFDLLVEANQEWCRNAAALVVFISRTTQEKTGRVLVTHAYDTGSAWMSLALQGWLKGLVVHGMAGFDYARARTSLNIPDAWAVNAMAAIGLPGRVEDLPERQRLRESPGTRRPLSESITEGPLVRSGG
jgi:nitroreductase